MVLLCMETLEAGCRVLLSRFGIRNSWEGVNHYRSHCGLAEFCGLIDRGEIQRCDWLKRTHILKTHTGHGTYKKTRVSNNHSAVFLPVHQTTEFRQTTV
jgi:hypothetical protein